MVLPTHAGNEFDGQLRKIAALKWLPWTGQHYYKSRILILGESQYEDGDEWQEDNINATRILVEKRLSGSSSRICANVEKVLLSDSKPTMAESRHLWESVIYYNLVQRLLPSIKVRPNSDDFDNGWALFFQLVDIVKPDTCIVLGKSSCGRLGYYLNNCTSRWERNVQEFYAPEKIIHLTSGSDSLKLIFINHPSGSRGFSHAYWARLVSENAPELRGKLKAD